LKRTWFTLTAILSIALGGFAFGFSALEALVAWKVHETGLFHGMPFPFWSSVWTCIGSFLVGLLCVAGGVFLMRSAELWPFGRRAKIAQTNR
jgi:hypothetical protein